MGDKILIDGIPVVLFLSHFPREELIKCVEELIKLFYPNLILGISDELPESVPEESLERVKLISKYCQKLFKK